MSRFTYRPPTGDHCSNTLSDCLLNTLKMYDDFTDPCQAIFPRLKYRYVPFQCSASHLIPGILPAICLEYSANRIGMYIACGGPYREAHSVSTAPSSHDDGLSPKTVRNTIAKPRRETERGDAGCSKASFGKAPASESPKRTAEYVEGLSDARTKLKALFNIRYPSRSCTARGSHENMPSR